MKNMMNRQKKTIQRSNEKNADPIRVGWHTRAVCAGIYMSIVLLIY